MSFHINNWRLWLIASSLFVAACTPQNDRPPVSIESTPQSDGAPNERRDVSQIAEPIPQPVVRTKAGNKSPYTVFGKTYHLLVDSRGYKEEGYASWYGTKFHGRNTSNGEVYDMWAMTAAHKTLPIPSYVRVTNVNNNKSVVVRVNDRGPFHSDRILDLSYGAASKLGFAETGVARVLVEDVTPSRDGAVEALPAQPSTTVNVVSSPSTLQANANTPANISGSNADLLQKPTLAPTVTNNPSTVSSAPQTATSKSMTLQVGAFKLRSSAERLKAKLSRVLDVPITIVPNSQSLHRVRVGPINGEQALATTRQLLSEQGIKSPYIVK